MLRSERTLESRLRISLVPVAFVALVALPMDACWAGGNAFEEAMNWFDPLFFQYNLVLALLAILIVPLITVMYVSNMKDVKRLRIERDFSPKELERYREEIKRLIPLQFRLRRYWGSMAALTLVITMGALIILLFKPYFPPVESVESAAALAVSQVERAHGTAELTGSGSVLTTKEPLGQGVDYGKGANMLLLGPFVEFYSTDRTKFYHQIVISLTAFQFGFLGAYIYFIGYLLRAYFTLDLSPHTYVAGSLRMVVSSILALVLSFALPALEVFGSVSDAAYSERFLRFLPLLAFFLGYFPNRALFLLEKLGNKMLGFGPTKYAGTPLADLAGMSSDHEMRLDREGFDNIENLSHARPIDLAVRTGFGYRQLKQWVGEARLRLHLENDFEEFVDRAGIRTVEELVNYWQGQPDAVAQHLKETVSPKIFAKLAIVVPLLLREQVERTGPLAKLVGA